MVEGKVGRRAELILDSSSFPIRAIKLSLLWRADRGSAHSTHPSREGTSSQPSPPSANYPDRPQCQECVLNLHLIPLLFLTNLANPTTLSLFHLPLSFARLQNNSTTPLSSTNRRKPPSSPSARETKPISSAMAITTSLPLPPRPSLA
jgi:hypothetical protein